MLTANIVTEIEQNVKERKQDAGLRFVYDGTTYDLGDRAARMAAIARVTEGCGGRPDPELLERLANVILDEELTDTHPDKVTNTEFPFMSEWQLDLRRDRETGLKAAEETGTDGRNYRKPTRRRRTAYENWRVDRDARSRNKQRQDQYKRDTAAGPVTSSVSEPFVAARQQADRWRESLSVTQ